MTRQLRLGPKRTSVTVERAVRVPMRDGTILVADHYAPVTPAARPTILMRCPYGRGWQMSLMARPFAERGYHVLLQSCRGTFGSAGVFTPGKDEAADGQDTVAWLRRQDWFDGRLATVGASYLAFTAWALALDPPPELFAMALHISPHDLATAGFGQGPFELYNLLMWSDLMAHQERLGAVRMIWRTMNADRRLAPALARLPLAATGASLGGGAPWYADWIAHADPADPYWSDYSAAAALEQVTVPTLLISGFHDFFVAQTMVQYQTLRDRGVPVGLTVGPWNHMTLDMGVAIRETVAWLDAFSEGNAPASPPRPSAVRVWTSGADAWQELADWPPRAAVRQPLYLTSDGSLGSQPSAAGAVTSFRYDPADPTPSVGGRTMSMRSGGSQDNSALEARPDVITFSTPPLERPIQVAGVPEVVLYLSSDNPHHDIFARLCDVDEQGMSRNLTDQIIRSEPGEVATDMLREISIALTDVSHVFLPGHQIRLQVSGGAHPRFARNLGTADLVNGRAMVPVTHRIRTDAEHPSALVLPVLGTGGEDRAAAADSPGRAASQR
ncbi:MAG TPA: CocE/NonD family hydrolase [Streptosporangiaceae bacterium]|nr:CocE/NonD family hydrolase [Streptosporangiaceae bacterium]